MSTISLQRAFATAGAKWKYVPAGFRATEKKDCNLSHSIELFRRPRQRVSARRCPSQSNTSVVTDAILGLASQFCSDPELSK